jgi:hypothetical protein
MIRAYSIEEQMDNLRKKKEYLSSNNIYDYLSSIIILDRSFEINETMNSICIIAHKSETLDYEQYIYIRCRTIYIYIYVCVYTFLCMLNNGIDNCVKRRRKERIFIIEKYKEKK